MLLKERFAEIACWVCSRSRFNLGLLQHHMSATCGVNYVHQNSLYYMHQAVNWMSPLSHNLIVITILFSWSDFSAENKLSLCTLPKSSSPLSDVALWERCNNMVLSWILNSVSSKIVQSIIYIEIAQVALEELKGAIL